MCLEVLNHMISAVNCSRCFKKIRPNDSFCPRTAPNSYTLRIERLFNNHSWVPRAPNGRILLINVASKVKMSLIAHNDFSAKFRLICMHFQNPIGKKMTFLMVGRLEFLCLLNFISLMTQDFH